MPLPQYIKNLSLKVKKSKNKTVNHQILYAAKIVAIWTIFVKLISLFKELITAWKFGTRDDLDAFLIAFIVPSFIVNVVTNSFNAALIPTYIQIREKEGIKSAQRLLVSAMVWSWSILILVTVLVVATAPFYLPIIALRFSPEKLKLTFSLLCIIAPFIFLSGATSVWAAALNAGERFALSALTPASIPIVTICLLFIFPKLGIYTLAIGLLGGSALELLTLGVALKRQGISFRPKWYGFDDNLRQVAVQYVPMMIAALLVCSNGVVDQTIAATLAPGSVAAIGYANRLIASPISLISTALSTAVIPYFSKMTANEDWISLRQTFVKQIRLILIITIPMALFFIVFSEPFVQIMFQRGAFTAQDTKTVAQIQAIYAFQIPFYVLDILAIRLLTSMKCNQIFIWFFGCNFTLNITLDYLFTRWFGIRGIALSTDCVYIFSSFALLYFAYRKINCLIKS